MKLKIKAFIYRLTGIYLAEKEANLYINSLKGAYDCNRISNEFPYWKEDQVKDFAISLWQAHNKFYR